MRPGSGRYLVLLFILPFLVSITPSSLFASGDDPLGFNNSNKFRSFLCDIATKELQAHSHCAYFQAPISHYQNLSFAHREPLHVQLPVMGILKNPQRTARKAVLVAGGGGPGNALGVKRDYGGVTQLLKVAEVFIDRGYDVFFADQRGTGASLPKLQCPELAAEYRELLSHDVSVRYVHQRIEPIVLGCKDRLFQAGIDVTYFNTLESAYDYIHLMDNLPYDEWAVFGVSYAAELAYQISSLASHKIELLILDSLPNSETGNRFLPQQRLKQRVDHIFALCRSNTECKNKYPGLQVQLNRLYAMAKDKPFVLQLDNGYELLVNERRLVDILFSAAYWPDTIRMLPYVVHEAVYEGRMGALSWIAQSYFDWMTDPNYGDILQLNIFCTQQLPSQKRDIEEHHQTLTEWSTVDEENWLASFSICQHWGGGFGSLPEIKRVDTPTLIFAGEMDPITPSMEAKAMQKWLVNSYFIEDQSMSHSVLTDSLCARNALGSLINHPRWTGAKTMSCSSQSLEFY